MKRVGSHVVGLFEEMCLPGKSRFVAGGNEACWFICFGLIRRMHLPRRLFGFVAGDNEACWFTYCRHV